MPANKELYVTNRDDWRVWLKANHAKKKEIWLIYYKKHTGKPRIPYEDAVEEALCFGWIDSIIKKTDDKTYSQKFTPRKDTSGWSESNKSRVEKMIKQGRMTEAGMAKIRAAKKNGQWDKTAASKQMWAMPEELENALTANKKAKSFFDSLAPSYQRQYIGWIASAKRDETREKRIKEAIHLLEQKQKLGMK
jgi:uncharacterized protein YdeI (YjbR/CyaY-like superfamily)